MKELTVKAIGGVFLTSTIRPKERARFPLEAIAKQKGARCRQEVGNTFGNNTPLMYHSTGKYRQLMFRTTNTYDLDLCIDGSLHLADILPLSFTPVDIRCNGCIDLGRMANGSSLIVHW